MYGPYNYLGASFDRKYVVFGKLLRGDEVLKKIESVGDEEGKPTVTVKIVNSGEFDGKDPSKHGSARVLLHFYVSVIPFIVSFFLFAIPMWEMFLHFLFILLFLCADKKKASKLKMGKDASSDALSPEARRKGKHKKSSRDRKKKRRRYYTSDSDSSDSEIESSESDSDSDSYSSSSDASSSSDGRHKRRKRSSKRDKYRRGKKKEKRRERKRKRRDRRSKRRSKR